jgi:predicted hydrocarbon binding protein
MVKDLIMFAGFNEDSRIVWFKITYFKKPGSLSLITDFLEKENVFIKFGHIDNITQDTGEYSIFTELKKDVDIEELAKKIEGLEVVRGVGRGISEFGMIYSVDFPLNVIGVRGVMARALTIVDIIKILNQSVPHAEGLLIMSGLRGGMHAAKYFKSIMPINNSNFTSMLAELYRDVGWGILEIDCNPETYEGKIIVKDSFIADVYGGSDQPVCAFMSGYFAGYLTEYFGKNISVREISCKATGKSVCEHIISLAPTSTSQEHQLRGEIK